MKLTYDKVRKSEKILAYIAKQDDSLRALGYTEHSFGHVGIVSNIAGNILKALDYSDEDIELVKIAAYMHDLGNIVNRDDHAQSGAIIAFKLLEEMDADPEDISQIMMAIGNHDEVAGVPVSDIAAALILADKSDVRRSRVRTADPRDFDIHDRVNYAVNSATACVTEDKKHFKLSLDIDISISSVMDYFGIFLNRMQFCKKAAERLGLDFQLIINGHEME